MDRKDNRKTNPPCHSAPRKPSPWISSATSHETKILGTKKRKYERAPTRNLLIKIKRREKILNAPILTDQALYESKLFKSRRISDLQKYLKSLRKSKHFSDEMYYNVVQDGQETEKQPEPIVKSAMSSTTSSPTFSPKIVKSTNPQSTQKRDLTTSEFLKKKSKDNWWASRQTKSAAQTTSEI